MKQIVRVGVAVASAAVVVGICAISFFVHEPTRWVTLMLVATGDTSTKVTYTCVGPANAMVTCTDSIPAPDTWIKRIRVPEGTVVRVQVREGVVQGWCSITDASNLMRLDHKTDGECQAVAR